jgi:hypothetical protein
MKQGSEDQKNSSTVQQFNSSTVQQFNSSTVQQFNSSTVQQFNSSTEHEPKNMWSLTRRTNTIRHQNEKQQKRQAQDEKDNHNARTGYTFNAFPITGTGNKTRRTFVTT